MKKVVNIAVDIETLSVRPTAAIIGVAAKPFSLGNSLVVDGSVYQQAVDATSCAMLGLDFDPATVKWWSEQSEEAKKQFRNPWSITDALRGMAFFIDEVRRLNNADEVVIWCQGTDFDIPILRNAYIAVNDDREEKTIPWKHTNVRDARTFIHIGASLIAPKADNPYSIIPADPKWTKHDALSDCERLIHNVTWIYGKLHDLAAGK